MILTIAFMALAAALGPLLFSVTPRRTSWWTLVTILLLVPAGGATFYLQLGSPGLADPASSPSIPAASAHSQEGGASLEQMAETLALRLRGQPEDVNGWHMLARTYDSMQRYEDAAHAYRQAMVASNSRPDIAIDYAEILIVVAGSTVTDEAQAILETVHTAAPLDPKARYYLGLAMADRGELRNALQAWTDLVHLSPKDAPWLPSVQEQIKRTADKLGVEAAAIEPSEEAKRLAETLPPPPASGGLPHGQGLAPPLKAEDADAIAALPEAEHAQMVRGMVEQLARQLNDNPNDSDGWLRLARAYETLGETQKAKEARARATEAK